MKAYVDPVDICGPDMSNGVEGSFCYRHTRAKNIFDPDQQDFKEFLVNEKGSVHQSFTKEDVSPVIIMMNSCQSN